MVLFGFIAVPLYLTYISKEDYGIWLAINSLVLLIALADLGTDQYITTISSNDEKFYSKDYGDYLTSIFIVKAISAILVAAISSITLVFLLKFLGVDLSYKHQAQRTFVLGIVALILGIFINALPAILYARHHYLLVNTYLNIFSIASIIGVYLLLKKGYGIASFPIVMLISSTLQGIIFSIILWRYYPHIKLKIRNFKFLGMSEILKYASNFQSLRWLYTFRAQYISIAITNLVGPMALTQYMLSSRLSQLGPIFSAKLALAFFPTMVSLLDKGEVNQVALLFVKSTKVLTRIAIFSGIFLFSINKSFVSIWVGEDKYGGDGVAMIIIIFMIVYIAMAQFAIVIFSSKKFEKWIYFGIIEIILAIITSYCFSIWLGLIGVVMGFLLSSLPTQTYLFRIVLRQLDLGTLKFIEEVTVYSIKPNLVPFLVSCTLIFLENEMNTWLDIIKYSILLLFSHFIFELKILIYRKNNSVWSD